jgi:hypothetical protein
LSPHTGLRVRPTSHQTSPASTTTAGDGLLTVADVAFTGRVVRFDVAGSTGGNTGAVEIAVYVAP